MVDEQQELDRVLQQVERTWSESRENQKISQELEHGISRILVIGSGAGIAIVASLLGTGAMEPRWGWLAACVMFFAVSSASSIVGLYFRVLAYSDLATKQANFAAALQAVAYKTRELWLVGNLTEETVPKPPQQEPLLQWRFNMWEISAAISAACFISGLVTGVVSVWPSNGQ